MLQTSCADVRMGAASLGREATRGPRTPAQLAGVLVSVVAVTVAVGWDSPAHARPRKVRASDEVLLLEPPAPERPEPEKTAVESRARSRKRGKQRARSEFTAQPVATDDALSPKKWLPSKGRECIRRGRLKGFCQGPRRVPEPYGEAAARAERLGMGERTPAVKLILGPPPQAWVQAAKELETTTRWMYPIENGRVWRGLGSSTRIGKGKGGGPRGPRRKPHAGLDIGADEGTPIRAVQGGIVVYSDNGLNGYGNLVMVVHADASVALYGHCRATYVFPGQYVAKGQMIAEVGTTGYALGAHLHLEYRVAGRPRDPTKLFDRLPAKRGN